MKPIGRLYVGIDPGFENTAFAYYAQATPVPPKTFVGRMTELEDHPEWAAFAKAVEGAATVVVCIEYPSRWLQNGAVVRSVAKELVRILRKRFPRKCKFYLVNPQSLHSRMTKGLPGDAKARSFLRASLDFGVGHDLSQDEYDALNLLTVARNEFLKIAIGRLSR